ncbi:MAG: hypothetical protein UU16_C0031G0011 [Candidatus Woesebacteria bacterium GW2011_GWA2_40_7]|uniref:Uncharacterized protein n=3 Tax=Candidatus Woeseibacteriota TaxID=1752722 RepID=A0A0G0XX59_9BACT|nr:MAG: hypothetical protein UT17_C0002G0137 [Candidatus Woesebacteria bacterium GW2011_GWB1_39_10]KKR73089.1 MAG: hypothetical protein UU16_C0031G0011 [Candidatus Woesebacteria bacterium GW2011_GWA2_40_7]KKR92512.1 MAG: hypothetical protein UU42_C0001G0116 [Candidatus Woesebacteria bacterium GW2011_GWA1_41_13b]
MDDTKKMLRIIINGQSVMKSELLQKIDGLDKKLSGRIDGLEGKFGELDKKLMVLKKG